MIAIMPSANHPALFDRRGHENLRPIARVLQLQEVSHKFPSTWVQMAIIVMNSASEASAAASWIRVSNMGYLPERASNSNASAKVPVGR